jgi:hypothetical protein
MCSAPLTVISLLQSVTSEMSWPKQALVLGLRPQLPLLRPRRSQLPPRPRLHQLRPNPKEVHHSWYEPMCSSANPFLCQFLKRKALLSTRMRRALRCSLAANGVHRQRARNRILPPEIGTPPRLLRPPQLLWAATSRNCSSEVRRWMP